ncbi:MAG: SPFH domain-containing protein [Phycisphaerales bacterium]
MTTPGTPGDPLTPPTQGASRAASVTLRDQGRNEGGALDPANQSLADALRLIFRFLQLAMVVLFAAFAFSGLQTVKETESGIKLLFGKPTADQLPPGPQFAAPYPFGELIKVVTGEQRLELRDSFWPRLAPEQQALSVEKAAQMPKASLKPGEDGSLITGDQNIAHARWSVQFRRIHPRQNVENILDEHESAIVRAAVERGVVHAVAQTPIDSLLKQSASDDGSVAGRAKALAQATLDQINSGIRIEQLTLQEKAPPFAVYNSFSGVQSAEQKASQQIDSARGQAGNIVNSMAGAAHEPLSAEIDRYEAATARADAPAQARTLETIHALLDGRPVTIGEAVIQDAAAGKVAAILNEARQHRSTIVSRRRAELASFEAKLPQFRTHPDLVVQRDWADAMTRLLSRDIVEVFWVPPGTERLELWLNRDLYAHRDFERARKLAEIKRKEEQQRIEFEREQTRTRTDMIEMSTEAGLKSR